MVNISGIYFFLHSKKKYCSLQNYFCACHFSEVSCKYKILIRNDILIFTGCHDFRKKGKGADKEYFFKKKKIGSCHHH